MWQPNTDEIAAAPCSQVQPVARLSMLFTVGTHTQMHIHTRDAQSTPMNRSGISLPPFFLHG